MYLAHENEPPERVKISIRQLGIAKFVYVRRK